MRMSSPRPAGFSSTQKAAPRKILNKTFYRFLFSFIAVIAGVLMFIIVLGVGSGLE
jgi:hypothetical protein